MWQPNRAQWRLIWLVSVLLILAWPTDNGSLTVKTINWAADPHQTLPRRPTPIEMGLGDDVAAVEEHDAEERAYYQMYDASGLSRLRLQARDLKDPLDPSTERQLLVGVAILCGLAIWRAEGKRART